MPFVEPLDAFFVDFNASVQLGAVGSEIIIKGIFDNAFIEINAPYGGGMSSVQPKLTVKSSDVLNVTKNTRVIVDSVEYTIVDIHPDGTGITELFLRKQ